MVMRLSKHRDLTFLLMLVLTLMLSGCEESDSDKETQWDDTYTRLEYEDIKVADGQNGKLRVTLHFERNVFFLPITFTPLFLVSQQIVLISG